MKGRRAPMHREELHQTLRNAFSIDTIYSEYGMTECMGQAWSKDGQGNFEVNAQFQVYIRPINQLIHTLIRTARRYTNRRPRQ